MPEFLCFHRVIYKIIKLIDHDDSVLSTVGLKWDTAEYLFKQVLDVLLWLM